MLARVSAFHHRINWLSLSVGIFGLSLIFGALVLLIQKSEQNIDWRGQAATSRWEAFCSRLNSESCRQWKSMEEVLSSNPEELMALSAEADVNAHVRLKIQVGYVLSRFARLSSQTQLDRETIELVDSLGQAYFHLTNDFPHKYSDESSLQQRMQNELASVIQSAASQTAPDLEYIQQLSSNQRLIGWINTLIFVFAGKPVSELEAEELYSGYLSTFMGQPPLVSNWANYYARLLEYDQRDTPETQRLKFWMMNEVVSRYSRTIGQDTPTCQQLQDVIFGESYTRASIDWITTDIIPGRIDQLIAAANASSTCPPTQLEKLTLIKRPWQEYLQFLADHPGQFLAGQTWDELQSTLAQFNVIYTEIPPSTHMFGTAANPITSIEQVFAITAARSIQTVGSPVFSPSRGWQLYDEIKFNRRSAPLDYFVYLSAPSSGWQPNILDYKADRPNIGTYIRYVMAHTEMMANTLPKSRYALPSLIANNRDLIIVSNNLLANRKQQLKNQITGFYDYAVPDIHDENQHPWKVQTMGPTAPGARPGRLMALDTWKTPMLPYAYQYLGDTYMLDGGGLHERGHLGLQMPDAYWANTTDYFWNNGNLEVRRVRCELFQQLQGKARNFLANSMQGESLSLMSSADQLLPSDWEHVYRANWLPEAERLESSSLFGHLFIQTELDQGDRPLVKLEWWQIDRNDRLVRAPVETVKLSSGELAGRLLFRSIPQLGVELYLVAQLESGERTILGIPSLVLYHASAQHQRAGFLNNDALITLRLATPHPSNYPNEAFPEYGCDPANWQEAAQHYSLNRLFVYAGIPANPDQLEYIDNQVAQITLPGNLMYVFAYGANGQAPASVFPHRDTLPGLPLPASPPEIGDFTVIDGFTPTPTSFMPSPTLTQPMPSRLPSITPTNTPRPPTSPTATPNQWPPSSPTPTTPTPGLSPSGPVVPTAQPNRPTPTQTPPPGNCEVQPVTNVNLSQTDVGLKITWLDTNNNEYIYSIAKRIDSNNYQYLTSLKPNTSTYTDSNVSSGHTYTYQVQVFGGHPNDTYGNRLCHKITFSQPLNYQ